MFHVEQPNRSPGIRVAGEWSRLVLMFHVEHCQGADSGRPNYPNSGQVDAIPPIQFLIRWFAYNDYPAGSYQLGRPRQRLQRRPETSTDRGIEFSAPGRCGANLVDIGTNGRDTFALFKQGDRSNQGVDPLLAAINKCDSQFGADNSDY